MPVPSCHRATASTSSCPSGMSCATLCASSKAWSRSSAKPWWKIRAGTCGAKLWKGNQMEPAPQHNMLTINSWDQYMEFEHVLTIVIKRSFMEETPSCGLSHSHQPRDPCVQLACALRDHELAVSPAQRSLCPVGMCLKRSWSHILISPEIIVSSWRLREVEKR